MGKNIGHLYCSTIRGLISSLFTRFTLRPNLPAKPKIPPSLIYSRIMYKRLHGILMRGYRVASGPSKDYPYGTIEKQKPYFKERGLDLQGYFDGTLNVSIAPLTFEMAAPEITFDQVKWTTLHPPETFSFSRCKVIYKDREYAGWVYYPHPETKKSHFQNSSLIEVLTHEIPNIQYGDAVELEVNEDEITVRAG